MEHFTYRSPLKKLGVEENFAYFGILMRFVRGRTTLIWLYMYIRQFHVCLLNFWKMFSRTKLQEAVNKRHKSKTQIQMVKNGSRALHFVVLAKWMMKGRLIGLLVQHFDCFSVFIRLHTKTFSPSYKKKNEKKCTHRSIGRKQHKMNSV